MIGRLVHGVETLQSARVWRHARARLEEMSKEMPRRGVNVPFTAIIRGKFFLPAAPQIHSLTDMGVWGAQFRQALDAARAAARRCGVDELSVLFCS